MFVPADYEHANVKSDDTNRSFKRTTDPFFPDYKEYTGIGEKRLGNTPKLRKGHSYGITDKGKK